jgi:hypothetical protein
MPRWLFCLYFDSKGLAALRAAHGVLAFFLGQAQNGAAMVAFAIDMGLAVAEFVFLQLEKAAEFVPHLQKFAILRLTAIDVAGEKAEEIQRDDEQLNHPKNDAFEKYIDQQQDKIDPEDGTVEFVVAVSAVHEADDLIGEFVFRREPTLEVKMDQLYWSLNIKFRHDKI